MKKKRRLKKSVIYTFIIIIVIILVCLFFIFKKTDELKIIYKDDMSANIYSDVNILDYVKVENGSILSDNDKLDTSSLGNKNIEIRVKDNNGNETNVTYVINVVDKEKPIIIFKDSLETYVNVKIDLLKDVKVEDNSKEEIDVEVVGDYDFNKVGEYNLEYVAKDSTGNEAREKFVLKVIEKKEENNSSENNNTNQNSNSTNNNNSNANNSDGSFTTSKGFKGVTKNGITYINNLMIINKTYSVPESYAPGLNSTVEAKANEMFSGAKNEGYSLRIQSGFRSYATQKRLYNNYVNGYGKESADTFSARPGHSEHQSGFAFDVCSNDSSKGCINSSFDNTLEAKWLANNCYKYGFILRYPKGKESETGYMYESWHFRYVGDVELATKLYNNGNWITLEDYFGITSEYSY